MESIPRPVPKKKLMLNRGFHELKKISIFWPLPRFLGIKKFVIRRIKATLDLGQACLKP